LIPRPSPTLAGIWPTRNNLPLMNPARNIELKARLRDLAAARYIALQIATEYVGVQQQTDTYFICPQGRMKLREIVGQTAYMVWYDRPDDLESKDSNYLIQEVDAERVRTLKSQMGFRAIIAKRREVFLHENVRIHLDEVEQLGSFIEFEAVLSSTIKAPKGRRQLTELQKLFRIEPEDLLRTSYVDMLLARAAEPATAATLDDSVAKVQA
jgi:adenylate cyclase class 2